MKSSRWIVMSATLLAAGALPFGTAGATMIGDPQGIRTALDELSLAENAQHVWRGREYCWYDNGWHGPGWYRCGFRLRQGFGWGGPFGWNNWPGGFTGELREGRRQRDVRGERRGRIEGERRGRGGAQSETMGGGDTTINQGRRRGGGSETSGFGRGSNGTSMGRGGMGASGAAGGDGAGAAATGGRSGGSSTGGGSGSSGGSSGGSSSGGSSGGGGSR